MTEIERIARQLCTDAGVDPDARAIHFRNAANGPNGHLLVPDAATFAAWQTYAPMVRRVIDLASQSPTGAATTEGPKA